jgi:c-di-GMP-binding flagellar brake protein YcgR
MPDSPRDPSFIERRVHARVQLRIDVDASSQHSVAPCEAQLVDISLGGALFTIAEAPGELGETIELFIPLEDETITIMAEIVRITPGESGQQVAVRFSLVEPAQQQNLRDMVEGLLDRKGGGQRHHPRLIRRIKLTGPGQASLMMEDISEGGMALTVSEPLVTDQEIGVVVPKPGGRHPLSLRVRVCHQRPIPGTDPPQFRVGVRFVHDLSGKHREMVRELLRDLIAGAETDEDG